MRDFLKNLLMFETGRKAAWKVVRSIGFVRFGLLMGVIGGLRYLRMRRQRFA